MERSTPSIDNDTFYARAKERIHFEIRPKEKWDEKGRAPHMCPAAGNSPTVKCPIRDMARKAVDKPRPVVAEEDIPDFLDKICTQHSVSINQAAGLRQRQAFPYKSKEWTTFHAHARNSIESLNALTKDKGADIIETSGRRRARGFVSAQILITMMLTNFNLYKIADFIREEMREAFRNPALTPVAITRRRRDRDFHNPYTGTYPKNFMSSRSTVLQT